MKKIIIKKRGAFFSNEKKKKKKKKSCTQKRKEFSYHSNTPLNPIYIYRKGQGLSAEGREISGVKKDVQVVQQAPVSSNHKPIFCPSFFNSPIPPPPPPPLSSQQQQQRHPPRREALVPTPDFHFHTYTPFRFENPNFFPLVFEWQMPAIAFSPAFEPQNFSPFFFFLTSLHSHD